MTKKELQEAKQLLATLKSDKWWEGDTADRVLDIIYTYQEDGEFITEDELDELTRREAESGAMRVMLFLAHCEPGAPFGYRLNGYANAEDATKGDLIWELENIIKANEE